jgi:hypothetical protein
MADAVDASSSAAFGFSVLSLPTGGESNAPIIRSSVGCLYRASIRVDEWPEMAITV